MTQPAVTQHIQYLEELYGCKLFNYSGRILTITTKGQQLYLYTMRMIVDSNKIKELIMKNDNAETISFGATLSIGEYIMPNILGEVMHARNDVQFNLLVENTMHLLQSCKMVP